MLLSIIKISRLFAFLSIVFTCFILPVSQEVQASTNITSSDFVVPISTFSPLGTSEEMTTSNSKENVNNLLARVLNSLIVIFGVAAVFFMTLGAGYMIIYHGQDELLSKGKTIFTSGLIALVVALSAGLIVRLFIYLLYTT